MESRRGGRGRWTVVEKPEGGFRLIPVEEFCVAWSAYRAGRIRPLELQVWFAAQAVVAKRCTLASGREPSFQVEEVAKLVGRDVAVVTRALRRLGRSCVLSWSKSHVTFGRGDAERDGEVATMLQRAGHNARRPVPVPRRTLELLAKGQGRVMTAAILGHLLRCVFFSSGRTRERGYSFEGRVKAGWVAEVFGVSLRGVKGARKELLNLGWLVKGESGQWALNRWGSRVSVNPAWNVRPEAVQGTSHAISAPPQIETAPVSAPLRSNQNPLRGVYNNQKPASGRPDGPFQAGTKKEKPVLRDVKREDLADVDRLRALFTEATSRKWVRGSEAEFLEFVAAAEHAKRVGDRNPAGLFIRVVRDQLSRFISGSDEDAAWRRIKRHEERGFEEPTQSAARSRPVPVVDVGTSEESGELVGREAFAELFASLVARTRAA